MQPSNKTSRLSSGWNKRWSGYCLAKPGLHRRQKDHKWLGASPGQKKATERSGFPSFVRTMNSTTEVRAEGNWPPKAGEPVSFKSGDGWKTGILQEVRWGLVWRDFILDDGRVIPEIKVAG